MDDILNGGPCPTWKSGKTLPVARLATNRLIVTVDAVVRVGLLATTLAGKHMATFPYGARTTIEDIIHNLNVWGVEERKRTVLAGSRKRADILYPLKWKYIVFVLINYFLLCLFY